MERYGGGHDQKMHSRFWELVKIGCVLLDSVDYSFFARPKKSLNSHGRCGYRINVPGAAQKVDVDKDSGRRGLWNVPKCLAFPRSNV
jgi:hypothetical protein